MPVITKLTLEDKLLYKTVVNAHGTLGATVNKIDHGTLFLQTLLMPFILIQTFQSAATTRLILDGKSLSSHSPAFLQSRAKADLLRKYKKEVSPSSSGIAGMFHRFIPR